ncbi:MAG: DUF4116 domain-containing protein [Candidatus Rhabdochlamydia sp.]
MSIPSNFLSPCTHSRISLSSLETIDKTVQAIHTLLEKEVLCQHDITDLNQAYQKLDQLKSRCDLISHGNSKTLLYKTMQKVDLQYCKVSLLGKKFAPCLHVPSLTAEKIKKEALQFVSERLKKDREVALAAVKQNGGAFEFAEGRLKEAYDLTLAAVWKYFRNEQTENQEKFALWGGLFQEEDA